MPDAPGYAGQRVIVAGVSGVGIAVTERLVALGAEVHVIGEVRPDVAGIASFTECDLHDVPSIRATIAKVGAYVNGLFVCTPAEAETIAEAVEQIALPGAQILTNPDDAIATLSRAR